jgi:[acyl-carrier-protein] S-malonyltransferase
MSTTALLFPGQGAQAVGMGVDLVRAFPVAGETFEAADAALGYPLSRICFDGPAERLTATEVCQPAILTVSVAAFRVAREHGLEADLVMGHSLGEYSALVAAGAIEFTEAVRLVAERGAAMAEAGERSAGAMAALIGLDDAAARALAERAGDVWPANFNCPGQVVASGTAEGIDRLLALAGEEGVRATRLAVSGAFHTPLMAPAAERLEPALAAWDPAEPSPEFLSTTTCAIEGAGRLRAVLLEQLTAPVRFGAAVEVALDRGVERFVELGPGRVLSGLVRRVRRSATTVAVGAPDDLAALSA